MKTTIRDAILTVTGASDFQQDAVIQTLWSGYGEILRLRLLGADESTAVLKYVSLPDTANHPRGWNTDLSHRRKIRSYEVESDWYAHYADRCDSSCRVPACKGVLQYDQELIMVLEDLDASGFDLRYQKATEQEISVCVRWLANFHALFLGQKPEGLWSIGTYWHLDTRPDELLALPDGELKHCAVAIDKRLSECQWQTFVHGDAKLANFCFSSDKNKVAAVDFQYVGGGCGMKDLAYFLSSCLNEHECESYEQEILALYFSEFREALKRFHRQVPADAIEKEWRDLYPIAWTDFFRFLQGWSPGHWKIHGYSERLARETIESLR